MKRPLVTIVTAAYKSRPEHLTLALRSAVSQTWCDLEILVSDDSPTDALKAVVHALGDDRVRYRHNPSPLGAALNHWTSFREASGEYLAVLNHDDCFAPDFVERLVAPLEQDPELALAFCDHWIIDDHSHILREETDRASTRWGRSTLTPGTHQPFFDLMVAQTIPLAVGAVFRRRLLPEALPDMADAAYDLWLTYLLARGGRGAHYVPDRLTSWRLHPTGVTSLGSEQWAAGAAACWRAVADDERFGEARTSARAKGALAYFNCAKHARVEGRPLSCLRLGAQSLAMRLTWRGVAACMFPLIPNVWMKRTSLVPAGKT